MLFVKATAERRESERLLYSWALSFLPVPSCLPAGALSRCAGLWHYSPSPQQGCSSDPAGRQFMHKLSLEMQRSEKSQGRNKAHFWSIRKENQELWNEDEMGYAEWVKYLCRLGFSVDLVHRLRAGIDSMGKLLFHILIGLGYFPNAEEEIRDWISICSKQETFSDWVSPLKTHLTDISREGNSLWQSMAVLPDAVNMQRQSKADFTCTTPAAYQILHMSWDQPEIQAICFRMTMVMWKVAAHMATDVSLGLLSWKLRPRS